MEVQRFATARNSLAEQVSGYLLRTFAGTIIPGDGAALLYQAQAPFTSSIARDKWDHRLRLPSGGGGNLDVWGQTTCYKGHEGGGTESNKTYEVRETLTECLSLVATHPESESVRTIHITYGDPQYGYAWFRTIKEMTFDLSLYINLSGSNVYDAIAAAIGCCLTEAEIASSLDLEIERQSHLGKSLTTALNQLVGWWNDEKPAARSAFGRKQAALVQNGQPSDSAVSALVQSAVGRNLKAQLLDSLANPTPQGTSILDVVRAELLASKPFLVEGRRHAVDWALFVAKVRELVGQELPMAEAVRALWSAPERPMRESLRRVLLRCHTPEAVNYVQDLGVVGITEHNLYAGDHSDAQTRTIARRIAESNAAAGNVSTAALIQAIESRGRAILTSQLYFEARNGTQIIHSFSIVQKILRSAGYGVVTPASIGIELLGYHADIVSERIRPYQNFRVIVSPDGVPLALIKAKFFSVKEFDRRCKEESFVGLTLANSWTGESFTRRFELPLIMYVDMEVGFTPPLHSVKKLMSFGWSVVFGIEQLQEFLSGISYGSKTH